MNELEDKSEEIIKNIAGENMMVSREEWVENVEDEM